MNISVLQCFFSVFIIVIIFPSVQVNITKYITYARIYLRRRYRRCDTESKKILHGKDEASDSDEDLPPE